jgi:hypothetical protein
MATPPYLLFVEDSLRPAPPQVVLYSCCKARYFHRLASRSVVSSMGSTTVPGHPSVIVWKATSWLGLALPRGRQQVGIGRTSSDSMSGY